MVEVNDLHKELAELYGDFSLYCKKLNVKPILSYGTLLGKLKYNGFIPWDDDIDILFTRKDYDKIMKNYRDIKNNDIYLLSTLDKANINIMFGKVVSKKVDIKTTSFIETHRDYGLYIDFAVIDKTCKFPPFEFIKRFLLLTTMLIFTLKCNVIIGSEVLYKKSKFLWIIYGALFRLPLILINHKILYHLFHIGCKIGRGKKYHDYTSMQDYFKKPFIGDNFNTLIKTDFIEHLAYTPGKPEKFLEAKYGDWNKVIPAEKQIPKHGIHQIIRRK